MTNSKKQQDALESEEKPSGRPIKGVKRERKSIMVRLDQIAWLESHRAGTWSKLVGDSIDLNPKFQAWRQKHWEPKHPEPKEKD